MGQTRVTLPGGRLPALRGEDCVGAKFPTTPLLALLSIASVADAGVRSMRVGDRAVRTGGVIPSHEGQVGERKVLGIAQ